MLIPQPMGSSMEETVTSYCITTSTGTVEDRLSTFGEKQRLHHPRGDEEFMLNDQLCVGQMLCVFTLQVTVSNKVN